MNGNTHRVMQAAAVLWLSGLAAGAPAQSEQSGSDPGFGRFFTTPGTRAELNNARDNYTGDTPSRPAPSTARPAREAPQSVKLNGVILRSDGSGQVWINGSSSADSRGVVEAVSLDRSRRNRPVAAVTMPGGNSINLRPGEEFSLKTGKVRDSFQQEGVRPEKPASGDDKAAEDDAEKTAESEDMEEFDEAELADRDFRIRLLEKRLEKLESSLGATDGAGTPESQDN